MTDETQWSPDPPLGAAVLPMFPLPNLYLFPGSVIPLHIFEPRYRQMVEDMLDGPGRFVLATLLEGYQDAQMRVNLGIEPGDEPTPPRVHSVAGVGEIGRHNRLEDGTFEVLVVGLGRVRIEEVESDRLYRKVQAEPLQEVEPDGTVSKTLKRKLIQALNTRLSTKKAPLSRLPVGQLTDLLLLNLHLPQDRMLDLFSKEDITLRAIACLQEHTDHPPKKRRRGDDSSTDEPNTDDDDEPDFLIN